MNSFDYKQHEGQRIQQVLAAIGALPAAMLVFGDGPGAVAAGAPLFAAAIALVVGALMSWNYTDAAYFLDCAAFTVPFEESDALDQWQKERADYGTKVQYRTYGYGVASLLCSMLGTAAVYSTLKSGIGVNAGFVLATLAAVMTCFDVVRLGLQRNTLFEECRRLADTDVGQDPPTPR